jgi:hypothetical protein
MVLVSPLERRPEEPAMTFERLILSIADDRQRRRRREAEIARLLRVRRAARRETSGAR